MVQTPSLSRIFSIDGLMHTSSNRALTRRRSNDISIGRPHRQCFTVQQYVPAVDPHHAPTPPLLEVPHRNLNTNKQANRMPTALLPHLWPHLYNIRNLKSPQKQHSTSDPPVAADRSRSTPPPAANAPINISVCEIQREISPAFLRHNTAVPPSGPLTNETCSVNQCYTPSCSAFASPVDFSIGWSSGWAGTMLVLLFDELTVGHVPGDISSKMNNFQVLS